MNRLDDVLKMKNVAEGAKEELIDAKQSVRDLKSLAMVANSEGGKQLYDILKEDCRDIITQMINTKRAAKTGWENEIISSLLPTFEAKFTLFNTLKSAPQDYEDAEEALEERVDEILEG